MKKAEDDPKYATHHDLECQICKKIVSEAEHELGEENHKGVKPCIQCWYEPKVEVEEHECTGGTTATVFLLRKRRFRK